MTKESRAQIARRRFNELVDYCSPIWLWRPGKCENCPYPNQRVELYKLGARPAFGKMYDQFNSQTRAAITQILGKSAKEMN